eukprot:scaffold2.g7024.t1
MPIEDFFSSSRADDLFAAHLRSMQQAQHEMETLSRQLDARAERAATGADGAGWREEAGAGWRSWRREQRLERPGQRQLYSESVTVWGPQAAGSGGTHAAPATLPALPALGLLAAAALAGFWAFVTRALARNYEASPFRERSRPLLLAAWPLFALASPRFREQLHATLRGRRPAPAPARSAGGERRGEERDA